MTRLAGANKDMRQQAHRDARLHVAFIVLNGAQELADFLRRRNGSTVNNRRMRGGIIQSHFVIQLK
ncbi:hypothetical protein FHT60_003586 [Novosphingobium sp. BK486]|nr:hypothetical protein [Novosphingobium sp. BK280]MBB3450975.1 hypothetical protein [Novosphingobium sp. BK352]MBB3538477.1 hypothetical protein [Novosphingobium sp. BK486]MBB3599600.1 hypothetical protein [Novosphingobium sp. BK540]MBB3654031.1 hypothetical protein [Novosphingobium sp. BK626]